MRTKLVPLLTVALLCGALIPSAAQARGYGGRGFHGGYGHGGYGRGYYGGRGFFFPGVALGFGLGYDYGYGYGYGAEYYGPGYYGVPAPTGYAPAGPAEPATAYWYYCPPARAYYPYVRECPVAWQAVPPQQQPQAQRPSQQPVATEAPAGKKTYNLGDVLFDTGRSQLLPSATWALDQLVAEAAKSDGSRIRIEGYTDNQGDSAKNRVLSRQRAEAVKQYLISKGIAADRMEAVGNGEASPVADNATPEGRQQNRRVDVTLG